MDRDEITSMLQEIVAKGPMPLYERHFDIPKEDAQQFRNKLCELKDRELINAAVIPATGRDTHGLPGTVGKIKITIKGRDFLENKLEQPAGQTITTNVNVTSNDNAKPSVNIAPGGSITITNNEDSEKLLKILLSNIEASDLPKDQQVGLIDSIKSLFSSASPEIVAGLLLMSVQAMF